MNPSSYFESMGGREFWLVKNQVKESKLRKKQPKKNALQKKFVGGKNQEVGRRRKMPGD